MLKSYILVKRKYKMKEFIILGAGPCGLATGFGLSNNGLNVSIFEGRDVVGGLGGSEVVDGMTFDYGPHIYHTHDNPTNLALPPKHCLN